MNTKTLEKVDAVSRRVIHAANVPGRDEPSRLHNDGTSDIATYVYDGLAKRRKMTDASSNDTWWRWDGGAVQAVHGEGAGAWDIGTRNTTYTGKLADSAGSNPSSGTYGFYLRNHLGSIDAVTDTSKNRTATQAFQPYGTAQYTLGTAQAMGYTGHFQDADTGLTFAPYRYYNPDAMRWIMRDPMRMVDGPNMYAYVGGNPVANYDLHGLWGVWFGDYQIGNETPWLVFDDSSWGDLGQGAAATADGVIPLFNPFENYYVDPCGNVDTTFEWSRSLGAGSRDLLSIAFGLGLASSPLAATAANSNKIGKASNLFGRTSILTRN